MLWSMNQQPRKSEKPTYRVTATLPPYRGSNEGLNRNRNISKVLLLKSDFKLKLLQQ